MGTDTTDTTDTNSTDNSTNTTEPFSRESWYTATIGQFKYDYTNNWMYATALMGGHAVGGANWTRSGYWGNFTGNITEAGVYNGTRSFDNTYYRQMLLNGWGQELNINGTDNDMWRIIDYSWN